MIDQSIYELLKANASVIALIGDHIYPGVVPSKIKNAAIRYVVSDNPSEFDSSGVEAKKKASVQIDIFHKHYTKNRTLSQAIQTEFHGYKGIQGSIDISLIEVLDSDLTFDSKTREYRTTITLTVTYRET